MELVSIYVIECSLSPEVYCLRVEVILVRKEPDRHIIGFDVVTRVVSLFRFYDSNTQKFIHPLAVAPINHLLPSVGCRRKARFPCLWWFIIANEIRQICFKRNAWHRLLINRHEWRCGNLAGPEITPITNIHAMTCHDSDCKHYWSLRAIKEADRTLYNGVECK